MQFKIGNTLVNEDDFFPVIVKESTQIGTYVKGYNVDMKNVWKPTVNERLETKMESDNVMGIYAVCVKKNTSIVGRLPLGKNGKFAMVKFYLIRADQNADCKVVITGKEVNFSDGDGMQVPCKLKIPGPRKMTENSFKKYST